MVAVVSGGSEGHGSESGESHSHSEGTRAGADALAATGGTSALVYSCLGVGALALGTMLVRRLIGS